VRVGRFAVKSDPGRRRRRNEDSYVVEPPLFAVADGMGGAQAGEVASRLAAGALKEGGDTVEELIQEANRRVHQRSIEDPQAAGMGTTVTVAVVENDHVRIGHVGDSRAYLIRDGKLEQLTQDHSLVGELVRSGKLAQEEAETHPQRSVITRAVGTDPDVDVDTFVIDPQEGDLFLICSDGLTDMVTDTAIERLALQQRENLDELVKGLVKAANRGGGEDNITVIAFEIANGSEELEQTAVVPAPAGEANDQDDEDTLTEADNVPVVDTMIVSADELAAAYEREAEEPKARRRRSFLRRLFAYLLVLLLLAVLALLILWGLSR
jgi:serine/threonine protein phosphatase PrpC